MAETMTCLDWIDAAQGMGVASVVLSILIPELVVWLFRKVKPAGHLARILLNIR